MNYRSSLALALVVLGCAAPSTFAQLKAKSGKKAAVDSKAQAPQQRPAADEPAFLVTLEERTKPRKVFMPLRPEVGEAPREPYVATIFAVRVVRGDEPPTACLSVTIGSTVSLLEEDARKILQFKKDFDKRVAPLPEHVESASLTLHSRRLSLNFNPRTGECWCHDRLQVPEGFFAALSDALGDLEKLKAGKPSFQVSEPKP